MIIAEKIIFSIMAFYLFIIMFFKMIKKSDTVYIVVLLMQAIGIAFNFIEIIFKWNFNIFVKLLIYLISIIIPFVIITVEIKGQNVAEILKLLLVKSALKLNNTKFAKKVLLELISKYPKSYNAHKLLAEVYEKEGGMRKAIDEYVVAVDLNKKDYDSYYKISFLLNELDKKEDAKVMLQNLLSKKPEYLKATMLLGDICCDLEQYKEALNVYSNGLKYSPNDYDILYNMGIVYTMLNDFQNAKLCYEEAAIINSILYKAYYNIAQINLFSNDLDEAEQNFTRSLEDKELEADAYYNLGKIYMLRGDYDNAVKFVNLAIQIDNNYIKIATNETMFIPILSKFNIPIIDEEDIVKKEINLTPKEQKAKEHLENTYNVVDMLNMAKTRVARKEQQKDEKNKDLGGREK